MRISTDMFLVSYFLPFGLVTQSLEQQRVVNSCSDHRSLHRFGCISLVGLIPSTNINSTAKLPIQTVQLCRMRPLQFTLLTLCFVSYRTVASKPEFRFYLHKTIRVADLSYFCCLQQCCSVSGVRLFNAQHYNSATFCFYHLCDFGSIPTNVRLIKKFLRLHLVFDR